MAKLSPLLAQWGSMKVLIAEIAICLLLAALLGLLIGWLCKGAFARDKLLLKEREWSEKYTGLERRHEATIASTRNSSEVLGKRVEALDSKNKALAASLDANKLAVQKANVEAQRLGNKQKETHNRLEKIIAEKEREISQLQKENARGKDVPPRAYGFSSNKPAEVKPLQSKRRDSRVERPTQTRPDSRQQPGRDSSVAGGKPEIATSKSNSPAQTGFKPGTQRQPADTGTNTGQDSSARRSQTNVPDNRPPSAVPGKAQTTQNDTGENMQDTLAMESTNHDIDATSAIGSSDSTSKDTAAKPRKRSLWERVRGKGKTDDAD